MFKNYRLGRLVYIAVFVLASTVSQAVDWMRVDAVGSTACDDPALCCYKFTYEHNDNGFNVSTLKLTPMSGLRSCFDVMCFTAQTVTVNGTATTVTVTWPLGGDPTLTFNPVIQATTTVEFLLCPKSTCARTLFLGTSFQWEAEAGNGAPPEAQGNFTLNGCEGDSFGCLSCDRTVIYQVSDCMHDICYKRRSGSGLTGPILITFNPPLRLDCDNLCPSDFPGTRDYAEITVSDSWTKVPSSDTYLVGRLVSFEIAPPVEGGMNACEEVCITVPVCDPAEQYQVTMSDKNSPNNCAPSPTIWLKQAGETPPAGPTRRLESQSNYPNPVTSASDFRTMIPFSILASGEARITISSESGANVHSETQTFEGVGKHFFFFTGNVLPTGTYYYTIESPLGVPIVKRSLLIVK